MTTHIQFFAVEYHGGDMPPYARWRYFVAANDAEAVLAGQRLAPPKATSFTLYRRQAERYTSFGMTQLRGN